MHCFKRNTKEQKGNPFFILIWVPNQDNPVRTAIYKYGHKKNN